MRVADNSGRALDANVSLAVQGGTVAIIFESRGPERNPDYIPAFDLVVGRLVALRAKLQDAQVVSGPALRLPPDERRLHLAKPYPVALVGENALEFARLLRRAAAAVGRNPEAGEGGNPTKRLQLVFTIPGIENRPETWLTEQIIAPAGAADAAAVEEAARPIRIASGQGFGLNAEARKAVEQRAMDVARADLQARWAEVQDVSASRPFDFQCRDGDRALDVEVKGTMTSGASIVLTRNEVEHARTRYPAMALYIVSEISLTYIDGRPVASGGTLQKREPWNVDDHELNPIAFQCFLR